MKRSIPLLLACALLLTLSACRQPDYNGSRVGTPRALHMTYSSFHTTESQTLTLEAGEVIRVEVVSERGSVDLTIQAEDGSLLYEGTGLVSETATVTVEEAGSCKVRLIGNNAKGSIDVTIEPGESQGA